MKKIIPILFLFLSIFLCYFIYQLTDDDKIYISSIGDSISINKYFQNYDNLKEYNTDFTNKEYRINDLLNTIQYNQEITIENTTISIHQILKKSDIVILSIGMNDIYSKLNDDSKDIYTYLNNMINNIEIIFDKISRYDHQQVFILGYYNITNQHEDLYTYLNYKLSRISNKYHFTYIDLQHLIKNHPEYLQKSNNFYLNDTGYQEIMKLIVEKLNKT